MPDPSEVLTHTEVATLLKVHPATVMRLARAGKIPVFRVGAKWRFRRDQLQTWMLGQTPSQAPSKLPSIRSLLAPERMQLQMKAATREAAIQELVALVDATGLCQDARELARRVLAREDLSSSALATGAALPRPAQAAPELVKGTLVAYGRSLDGVAFGDGPPTRLFFLVCADREEAHAGALEALGRLCRNAAFCKELVLQNAPDGVLRVVEKAGAESASAGR